MLGRHSGLVVLADTETANWQLGRAYEWTRLIQFAVYQDGVRQSSAIIDCHPAKTTQVDRDNLAYFRELVQEGALFIFQNFQYDHPRLLRQFGIDIKRFRDTKILSQLAYCGIKTARHGLNSILRRENGFDPYEAIGIESVNKRMEHEREQILAEALPGETHGETLARWRKRELSLTKSRLQKSDWAPAELSQEQWDYAAMDVSDHFFQAWRRLEERIAYQGMGHVADLEHQVIPAVMDMERNGIKLHLDKWDALLKQKREELAELDERIRAIVDPWTQDLYPEKFLITVRRLKPRAGKPARYRKDGTLLREEVPAQELGDFAARQPTPELFPLYDCIDSLVAMQEGDRRIGSVVWAELGLSTTPENLAKHQFNITSATQMRRLVNDLLGINYTYPDGSEIDDQLAFSRATIHDLTKIIDNRIEDESGTMCIKLGMVKNLLEDHLKAQSLRKLVKTYGESYQKQADVFGYIRTNFQTTMTLTGRMSSSEPNIQNLPRDWQKALFCCEEGEAMVSVDYSNMEGRTLFFVTGQYDVYEQLTNGLDLHSMSASFMTGKDYNKLVERLPGEAKDTIKPKYEKVRQKAKALTFAPAFGCGPKKISELIDCSDVEAKAFLNRYWFTYSITKEALDKQLESAINNGYVTDLCFGRKRYFELTDDDRALLAAGERRMSVLGRWKAESYNYCAQAGGASCLKVALISLREWIMRHPETQTKLRLCVHDSIKVTCLPEHAQFVGAEIKRIMETAAEFVLNGGRVPADVEIYFTKTAPRSFERTQTPAA